MALKLTVNTDTGYRAEIHVDDPDHEGLVVVKSAAYIFKGILSPFVALKFFYGEKATLRAELYAKKLKTAIEEG